MSRPLKKGIDYFSMDVTIFSDRKIRRVIHSCGAASIAIILKLWCSIYDEKGYYISVDDDYIFDISADTVTE
jgi:hypothetical protein